MSVIWFQLPCYFKIPGFYKGMLAPFMTVGFLNSVLFAAYGLTLRFLHPNETNIEHRKDLPMTEVFLPSFLIFNSTPTSQRKLSRLCWRQVYLQLLNGSQPSQWKLSKPNCKCKGKMLATFGRPNIMSRRTGPSIRAPLIAPEGFWQKMASEDSIRFRNLCLMTHAVWIISRREFKEFSKQNWSFLICPWDHIMLRRSFSLLYSPKLTCGMSIHF